MDRIYSGLMLLSALGIAGVMVAREVRRWMTPPPKVPSEAAVRDATVYLLALRNALEQEAAPMAEQNARMLSEGKDPTGGSLSVEGARELVEAIDLERAALTTIARARAFDPELVLIVAEWMKSGRCDERSATALAERYLERIKLAIQMSCFRPLPPDRRS